MAAEKKRPRGLKSSAAQKAAKKTKVDEPTELTEKDIPEGAQTVVLDKVVEEGDEIGEAAALYESAVEKFDKDPSAALSLLRGTVHESDRILRNWASEEALPLLFYLTYGSALYDLGRFTEDEEFEPYLEAAEERLEKGLENYEALDEEAKKQNAAAMNKIKVALAKIWIAKAASSVSEDLAEIPDLAVRALSTLDEALPACDYPANVKVDLAAIVQNHGDLYSGLSARDKFRLWSESLLETVVKELGLCKLSLANYWLDQVEDTEGTDPKLQLTEEEQKAYDAIVASKQYFQKAHDALEKTDQLTPYVYADLAEATLNEANLVLEEEQQNTLYKQAVEYIKAAQEVAQKASLEYTLPEGLASFLEDWESESS
ncbi:nuclear pore complex subunit Nro1-domain-containing protein [Radiomyces spectabilis]|uniref:nuclear pore complex subunit Nro1-domain-containing protein n=1 Tax=Radiomyces spectabilis TaxID=64574 RepID=UPI00221EAC99|nr:nuclear pore complex subunit Nro1-domain-containing protein [Radiomyces spectabilis]KAI8379643.1 nuclear pore complex subunit Nro1-domain-containing protein [Radiomyces spectabilis]